MKGWEGMTPALLKKLRPAVVRAPLPPPQMLHRASPDRFLDLLRAHGLPLPECEVTFAPPRRWRADYLWRAALVIVERDGGIFMRTAKTGQGAHSLPTNILRDMEKGNAAQLLGYVYLRYTPQQLDSGEVLAVLKDILR